VGWVRDPRLTEPETLYEENTGIVAAFASSKRRLLIVGEPGSGKTMAAYALIEHLDETEGDERIPLLVNLSAWEAQESFEAFLVDYLVSEVGYQVRQRTVANAFIDSHRYTLVLDGLDEIPAGLRKQFSEYLDEFVRGVPSEVAVVVTCRTQEYEELLATHPTGLGLVQAVEMLPLTSQQLDSALAQLARFDDKDWETFLSQRDLTACQRARDLLSNPLFLNLAVAGHLNPRQLWECAEKQVPSDLVLERYLDGALADQGPYEPASARRHLTWVARFLNGAEVSPFGLKTSDGTVFDLADLTPPDPPRRYRLFEALFFGLVFGLVGGKIFGLYGPGLFLVGMSLGTLLGLVGGLMEGLVLGLSFGLITGLVDLTIPRTLPHTLIGSTTRWLVLGLVSGLVFGLVGGLVGRLLGGWPYARSAVRSRLTLALPSTKQQRHDFLGRAAWGLVGGLVGGLVLGLFLGSGPPGGPGLFEALAVGLVLGLVLGLVFGLVVGLVEPRSVLITARTPKEANSRSLIAALVWLVFGMVFGIVVGLVLGLIDGLVFRVFLVGGRAFVEPFGVAVPELVSKLLSALVYGLSFGLIMGPVLGLRNGGRFVLLQKVAHRRLAKAGNLPPRPADFLEWGIERQIFRRVGGGVRFRHNLIQQHLASISQ